MRARSVWVVAAAAVVASPALAGDPKPTAVDVKPYRDQLIVLQDAQGGTYIVQPGPDGHAFYGTGKAMYEQIVLNRSSNGETGAWSVGVFAPRVTDVRPGELARRADATFHRYCGDEDVELTLRTGDKAKAILDQASFMTTATVRIARMLARDDTGVYYYVDELRKPYGGKGFRVFVGKKGAMKELPLVDIAIDTGGEVFSTKTGDLRLTHDADSPQAVWARGDKQTKIKILDLYANSPLIYRDLGVYGFIGTICENL